jgi:hypothetical protein
LAVSARGPVSEWIDAADRDRPVGYNCRRIKREPTLRQPADPGKVESPSGEMWPIPATERDLLRHFL